MVRSANLRSNNPNMQISLRGNLDRPQLAIALAMLMLASVAVPSLPSQSAVLEDESVRFHTANGTIEESDAQTLLTNLNANNPIDVMGVLDDSNKIQIGRASCRERV